MKKYQIIWTFLLGMLSVIVLPVELYAQFKSIKIGERCPDVLLSMFNYDKTEANLSDFREPLVILDFWTTYCGSCIHGILKYHEIQQSYKGKVRFIPVTHENKQHVKNFWMRNPNTKSLVIPSVVEDTILKAYFPHETIGLQVWLSRNKTVLAITDAEYVNPENIDRVLKDPKTSLPERHDRIYNFSKSLYKVDAEFSNDAALALHAGLMGHLPGNLGTFDLRYDTLGETVRAYAINLSILDLYREALKGTLFSPNLNRFVLDTQDSSRYYMQLKKQGYNGEWKEKNTFCYEQTAALGTTEESLSHQMIGDLNRFLHLNGRAEQHIRSCWIVKELPDRQNKLAYQGKQYDFNSLLTALNRRRLNPRIVLNESNIKGNSAIPKEIYTEIVDQEQIELGELNKLLAKINLQAVEEERPVEIFILSDPK